MMSIENCDKAMLKLAQFRLLMANNKKLTDKDLTFIFQGLDLSLKLPDTMFLKEYNSELIGGTLLDLAYRSLNIDVFNVLIERGADFTAKNKSGNTVLHEIFHSFCGFLGFTTWDIKREQSCFINERLPLTQSVLSAHIKYNNSSNPSDSSGLTHFHISCATNNIKAANFFLSNGVSVNQALIKAMSSEYFEGYTALHFVAQFGFLDIIETLLAHSADANLKDAKGKTPLHLALERNIAMIDSTIEIYYSKQMMNNIMSLLLTHTDCTVLTRLQIDSATPNSNLTREVLLQVTNINQCISMDSHVWPGYTALHFAAHVNVNTVKLLVDHEADIEAKNAAGVTPFDMCIDRYNAEDLFIIMCSVPKWKKILLSGSKTKLIDLVLALTDFESIRKFLHKSDEKIQLFVPIDSPLWSGFTVLHLAVLLSERKKCKTDYLEHERHLLFSPNLTVITEILRQGADVTIKDQRNWTPIHLAFRLEKTETLDLLLKHHYKTSNVVDEENLSHLHIACAAGNMDLVEKLLCSTDVDIAYNGDSRVSCVYPGWTPLHVAVNRRDIEITKLLLKFGANDHAMAKRGFTPIHDSIPREFSRVLFSEGDLRDFVVRDLQLSYLHVACLSLNVEAVERLIEIGAGVNRVITWKMDFGENHPTAPVAKTHDGSAPLQLALDDLSVASPARMRIVSLLIERGADLLIKKSKNVSPLAMILEGEVDDYLNVIWTALKSNDELRKVVEIKTGLTMLHLACRRLDLESMEELLDNGADVNARKPENSSLWPGFTSLHVLILSYDDAKGKAFKDMVILLIKCGADVTLSNADKRTPLHMAHHRLYAEADETSMFQVGIMLQFQWNFGVNPTSPEGISHFHIACHILDVEAVENFLNCGQIDVNSSIDFFGNFVNAANSPLLLATGKKCWREKRLNKSSSKLRIVDLLIRRGARVDFEDLEGNTAAHNAVHNFSTRDNYLQRLANGGADMNAINIRGETPLELWLKEKNSKKIVEGLRQYIACGCRFNAFNPLTKEGLVALANSQLAHEDMLSSLTWTFVNYPDAMKSDNTKRNALHNLVAASISENSETQYAELFSVLMTFDCDIDDQDDSGMTALHLAVQFRNEEAVEGLLMAGANLNIIDRNGRTPFAHLFEPCYLCNIPCKYHSRHSHPELLSIFATQIQRMELCDIEVNKLNESLLGQTFQEYNYDLVDSHIDFLDEISSIGKAKIKPYSLSVEDFISDARAVIDYPSMSQAKRKTISAFFRTFKSCFEREFKRSCGIFQLQYRQAVLRRKIMDDAKDALSVLAGFRVPDTCSHIIMRSLKNSDLQNLILSKSIDEITNMDVDS